MHDRLDHHRMNEQPSLGEALRALPPKPPLYDAFPAIATRIRRRRTARRVVWFSLPSAFAAGIALMLALPHHGPQAPSPPTVAKTPVAVKTAQPDISALQASSARWQAWVGKLDRHGAPLDGRALSAAVSLQDRIGLVDLQISAAHNPATVADLWQQRIALLQQLGLVHLQPYRVASQTTPAANPILSM